MKIILYYFSGTGNTKKITELYEQEFSNQGEVATSVPLPIKIPNDPDAFDMIGIGYPVHAFNAPKLVLDFCKKLPKIKKHQSKKKVFIYKTSGEPVRMIDISSLKAIKILKKRGYDVVSEYHYVMPYNMIFRHSDGAAYKMWSYAQKLVPLDVAEIIKGETRRMPKKVFLGGLIAWIMRCEHWGAHLIGRFFSAERWCVKCGKCARICPVGNIKITKKGKVKFSGKCTICMRCAFSCPKNAINAGMLEGWKVNGEYSFKEPEAPTPSKHDNYCKKAYDRYYAQADERIKNSEFDRN